MAEVRQDEMSKEDMIEVKGKVIDRVTVELSSYDLKRGRITYRLKHEAA
jgi:translation initiation factor IF-1